MPASAASTQLARRPAAGRSCVKQFTALACALLVASTAATAGRAAAAEKSPPAGDGSQPLVGDAGKGPSGGPGGSAPGGLVGALDPSLGSSGSGGYVEVTPLCHYLERGINDHEPGKTDRHVVATGDLATLADVDRLAFGLDLPLTHCQDNPYSVPCMEEEIDAEWCIGKVRLYVLGMKLFEQSAPSGECLLDVSSSISGVREIPGEDLRSDPDWGISKEKLIELLSYVRFVDGKPKLEIPGAFVPSAHLDATIESVLGDYFARQNKGCANGTYCGDKRGPIYRFGSGGDENCDQGGCPSTGERKPSPWVEVERDAGQLAVDVDVALYNSTYDPGDAINNGQWDHGNLYTKLGWGTLSADLAPVCRESALVENPDTGGKLILPWCEGGEVTKRCFRKTGFLASSEQGVVECPDDDESSWCGLDVVFAAPRFDLDLEVTDGPTMDVEGGLIDWGPDVACYLGLFPACDYTDADQIANGKLGSSIDRSLLSQTLFEGLTGCPAFSISPAGDLTIDLQRLDTCPPGAKNPQCSDAKQIPEPAPNAQPFLPGGSGSYVGSGGEGTGPGFGGDALVTVPVGAAPWNLAPEAEPRLVKGPSQLVSEGETTAAKIKFSNLSTTMHAACAMARHCSAALDFAQLPLDQLLDVDFAELLEDYAQGGIGAVSGQLAPLLGSAHFKEQCIQHAFPGSEGVEAWYAPQWFELFVAEYQQAGASSCAAVAPSVEALIPASQVVVDVETRGSSVSDGYAFVAFRDLRRHLDMSASKRQALLDDYACAHLKDFYLPPSEAPACGADGRVPEGEYEGEPCGTIAGQACADIDAGYYANMWLYGESDPADERYHPNGDFSFHHRCDHDLETGAQMSCVTENFNGAGVNVTGVCKICGTPGGGDDPTLYTTIGCRPDGPCPDGTYLWPDGRCWDASRGLPEWQCEADCEGIYNGYGWCVNGLAWRHMAEDLTPVMDEYASSNDGLSYGEPICAERLCEGSGMACAAQGLACQPDEDACAWECWSDGDCQASDPVPAYPQGFVCHLPTHTCRLDFAAKP